MSSSRDDRVSRRAFVAALSALTPALLVARANAQNAQPRRIGWLKIQDKDDTPGQLKAFLDGLGALGQAEGRGFALDARFADGDSSRLTKLAEGLVQNGATLILATSQPAVDACRRVTQSVPIIGRMTDDPVQSGAARSLARPGGNVTGVYSLLEEMTAKRLALLQQAAPSLRRVGALLTLERGATAHWLAESRNAAQQLGLEIHVMNVHSGDDLDSVFATAAAAGVNGPLAFRNPTVVTHARRVVVLANRYQMPGIFDARDFVDADGFMSYGPNLEQIFRRLASFADQVLKGTAPGDLPIEQPTTFELAINLRTAKAMGISVPSSVLVSANEVIE